jgi:hypothetical protein
MCIYVCKYTEDDSFYIYKKTTLQRIKKKIPFTMVEKKNNNE